jgi:hypothetical protein
VPTLFAHGAGGSIGSRTSRSGSSVSDLFDQAGLDFIGEGRDEVAVGIAWRETLPAVRTRSPVDGVIAEGVAS